MFRLAVCSLLTICLLTCFANADSLYGTIEYSDGSKDKGTAAITTSYNKERGKNDGNGNYKLDFKTKVGTKVTVYVNGKKYTVIEVNGDTKLNIVIPK